MRLTDQEILEFDELMNQLIEESITEAQKLRLQNWLCDSKAARRRYIKFMDMNASLQHYAAEFQGAVPEDDPDDPEFASTTHSAFDVEFLKPVLLLASILVLGFFFIKVLPELQKNDDGEVASEDATDGDTSTQNDISAPPPPPVAILTQQWGLQWEKEEHIRKSNTDLPKGRMVITEGFAQIEFYGGTTVVVEGPADIDLQGKNTMHCSYGQLWAMVPEQSNGFKVLTDNIELLDLGTRFGMNVGERGEAEVYVFEGKVQLTNLKLATDPETTPNELADNDVVVELSAGESVFIEPKGKIHKSDMPKREFVGVEFLRDLTIDELRARYDNWLKSSQELREDHRLLLYYTFDDEEQWSRSVTDQALNKSRKSDGALVGCTWEQGRWPGKGALHFKRNGDRVKMDIPGEYDSITLSAWFRLERVNPTMTSLLLSDDEAPGRPYWQIDREGRIIFSTRGPVRHKPFHGKPSQVEEPLKVGPGVYMSDKIINKQVGDWLHLVTVYDHKRKIVQHYLDGKKVAENKITAQDKIKISRVEIGNWPKPDRNRMGTSLRGKIDELAIFQTPLTAEEIKQAYEIGRPGSLHGWLSSN